MSAPHHSPPPAAPRTPPGLPRKLLFSLLPTLLLLAGLETCGRLFPHRDTYATNTGFIEPDPDLLWRLKPQAGGPLATNALGLRDTAYNPHAEITVLLLGDSVSWGNGITNVRDVYPYLLEEALNRRHGPGRFEIINAGVPGYSTFQEHRYFERHGAHLAPDLVVLQLCLNDAVERYWALAEYGGDNRFLDVDTRRFARGLYGFFLRHSRAFEIAARWSQRRLRRREQYAVRDLARDSLRPPIQEAWDRMVEELEQVRRLAARRGLPLLLLLAPYRFQVEDPAGLQQPQDRLLAYARQHHLPAVDLLPPLAALTPDAATAAFNDESHFSEAGHAFVAAVATRPLEEAAEQAGLLVPTGGPIREAMLRLDRAAAVARLGDHPEALALLAEAEQLTPDDPRVFQYRANVAFLMGDRAAARQALERGLALAPDHPLFRENLDRLRRPDSPAAENASDAGSPG